MSITDKELEKFEEIYRVPEPVRKYTQRLFTEEEIQFAVNAKPVFGADEVPEDFLKKEYQRGFLNLVDETRTKYRLSDYSGFMDVYVVREFDDWRRRFTNEERKEIDWQYFHSSFDKKAAVPGEAPSEDEVWPLDEVLDFIDHHEGQIYLNNCDCRSFAGDCGMPRHTCITWRGGINTYADRGMAQKLTKEEAKEKVKEFDKAGLMHTLQVGGDVICNCCGDCCYLSRGREILGSGGSWPLAHYIVSIDSDKCVGCGLCAKRCWRKVFTIEKDGTVRKAVPDTSKCVGCGLCVNSCPKQALNLEPHKFPKWPVQKNVAPPSGDH
jgi:ferredoxin